MSMAIAEDAASVLDQFVQDVANLPAEVAHLLEEIEAKDRFLQECRNTINTRDNSLQKFIKLNGSLQQNPKEEAYSRTISQNFDKAQILQEEKLGLSEKAAVLLDRHIKRLDIKIRDLQNEGTMSIDPLLPSLLHSTSANRVPPASAPSTGVSAPLNPLSGNAGASTTIATSGLVRLAHPAPPGGSPSMISGVQPHHPLLNSSSLTNTAPNTPAATALLNQRNRESSTGPMNDAKRRRLGLHIGNLPSTSSNLARQSSLGPGTPKAGTPGSTRGGSAGPRGVLKKKDKKLAPHQQARKRFPKGTSQLKKTIKKMNGGIKASPSDDDSDGSGSDDEDLSPPPVGSGVEDEEMEEAPEEEDNSDDTKYCTCRNVSYGNMVACDNEDCPYEWFHWNCVGMTKEPTGTWYCDECRSRMGRA